jgi:transcriptional regulator with XRE-family HTH domain
MSGIGALTEAQKYHFYRARSKIRDESSPRDAFSRSLKELRLKRGLAQTELCDLSGIKARNTIWQYETQYSEPTLTNLVALADVLGVTLDDLAGRSADAAVAALQRENAELRGRLKAARQALGEP